MPSCPTQPLAPRGCPPRCLLSWLPAAQMCCVSTSAFHAFYTHTPWSPCWGLPFRVKTPLGPRNSQVGVQQDHGQTADAPCHQRLQLHSQGNEVHRLLHHHRLPGQAWGGEGSTSALQRLHPALLPPLPPVPGCSSHLSPAAQNQRPGSHPDGAPGARPPRPPPRTGPLALGPPWGERAGSPWGDQASGMGLPTWGGSRAGRARESPCQDKGQAQRDPEGRRRGREPEDQVGLQLQQPPSSAPYWGGCTRTFPFGQRRGRPKGGQAHLGHTWCLQLFCCSPCLNPGGAGLSGGGNSLRRGWPKREGAALGQQTSKSLQGRRPGTRGRKEGRPGRGGWHSQSWSATGLLGPRIPPPGAQRGW